jgi:adenosine deaminase
VLFARHVAENVRYVETSFHLRVCEFCSIPPREIIRAIKAAAPPGLEVRVFAGMLRTDYEGGFAEVIDAAIGWEELDGVDLHGFEQEPTQAWTAGVWQRFRDAGKVTKCHAGEFDGAHRVREAIEQLGVRRIQHGVRAVEDASVVALAAAEGAVFDVCPISNVRLKVTPSIAVHPLRTLLRAGVACTISTDDPLVFGNTLTDEYVALAEEGGFSLAELAQFARTGFAVASIDAPARDRWISEINRVLSAFTAP